MIQNNKLSKWCKSLVMISALASFSPSTFADAHDSRVFGVNASTLLETAKAAQYTALNYPSLEAPDLSSEFIIDLQRLGISAARLSREIREINGPEDFQCIFRGMAKETGDQLNAISNAATGADQADALKRIISMLDDAIMVSEATALTFEGNTPAIDSSSIIGSCAAE